MPMLQNQYMSGQPVNLAPFQQPEPQGLMANPSAFQFLSAMMNQPGGFNQAAIPGYGTANPFGVPMYLPQYMSPRSYGAPVTPPPPVTGGGGSAGGWTLNNPAYGYQDNPPGIRKGSER